MSTKIPDYLAAALHDAERGHRPHEYERVAADLAISVRRYFDDPDSETPSNPLNSLAKQINDCARAKGWWDEERSVAEMLANIHGEVSEAWEDWRVGREEATFAVNATAYPREAEEEVGRAYRTFVNWANDSQNGVEVGPLPEGTMDTLLRGGIAQPIGMVTEVADVIIRCLDMLHSYGIDIDDLVRTKMIYNWTRPVRHGGKRA